MRVGPCPTPNNHIFVTCGHAVADAQKPCVVWDRVTRMVRSVSVGPIPIIGDATWQTLLSLPKPS
jgi:hypothetical protein